MKKKGKKANQSDFKSYIFKSWYNKYMLSMILFVVWISFFDKNNLLVQYKLSQKVERLDNEKDLYDQKLELARAEKEDLENNKERYAREKYFAKKDNEEVYIIENK